MIRITDFEKDYISYDMRNKKVMHPNWFKCRVNDSPEMQAVLYCDPNNMMVGLAVIGAWEQLQRWSMRHWTRGGRFVLKTGQPMTIELIAIAVGLTGQEEFLKKAIEVLMGVGWLCGIDDAPDSVLPLPREGEEIDAAPPTPKSLPPKKKIKDKTNSRFNKLIKELSKDESCPLATESPALLEQALTDAAEAGRDVDNIVRAMRIYYSLETGKNQYRARPQTFVNNRKDEEVWDVWFTTSEAKAYKNRLFNKMVEATGRDQSVKLYLMEKYSGHTPMQMQDFYDSWEEAREKEESGYDI